MPLGAQGVGAEAPGPHEQDPEQWIGGGWGAGAGGGQLTGCAA